MNIKNLYLDAMFSTQYFAEVALVDGTSNSFNFIRFEENLIADNGYGNIIGESNKLLIRQSDLTKYSIVEEMAITINEEAFLIKNIIKNSDGTANLVIEIQ